MPFVNISDIVEKVNAMPDGLTRVNPEPQLDNDDLDQLFKDSNKRQRNWMSTLDHFYERISHPFMILIFFIAIFIVFIVFRYLDVYHCGTIKIFSQIHQDTMKVITYFGAVILTWAITKVLESRKRSSPKG